MNPDAQRQLDLLVGVVHAMSTSFELIPLLEAAERAGRDALRCERAAVFLHDRDTDELYSTVATGDQRIRFPAAKGIAGDTLAHHKAILVPDAYADPRFNPEVDKETGFRTRNLLSVPLRLPTGEAIGVLQLLNKADGAFGEEDATIGETLGALLAVAIKRQLLLDESIERQRLEHDLDVARQIQQHFLPSANPHLAGYDIAGWNRPADHTGGDCYGFQVLHENRLGFLIADASGHGIGPALIITECRAMVRALAKHNHDLVSMACETNRLLYDDLADGRFVTACLGWVDAQHHEVRYVSAGHGPILWLRANTGEVVSLRATGLPFGILPDTDYTNGPSVTMAPGDLLCLLTDGVTEWARPDHTQYGEERFTNLIRQHAQLACDELIRKVHEDLLRFGEGSTQGDDLTLILIKRCR